MSSDGLFDDDDAVYDDAFFEELETNKAGPSQPAPRKPEPVIKVSDDEFADSFDFDDAALDMAESIARSRKFGPTRSVQTTLDGDILPEAKTKPRSNVPPARKPSHTVLAQPENRKTRQWDHTEYAKSGNRRAKSKNKGRGNSRSIGEDDEEEEDMELDEPSITVRPPTTMKLKPDLLEAKHLIYPRNKERRDYQFNIVRHCLFENTIVALPTGLGKTFIAGVVMLNYYNWFPEGKIVFVAPTRPLVAQQIEASHQVCGIPGTSAVELTGQNPVPMRARAWKEMRVFYMTPQTLYNDLVSKTCDATDIVLIVFDEAHRATGDYAYNQVMRYMMAHNPFFRVLALSATPGANGEATQRLIDGLHIDRIEIRDESSLDLKQYIHEKKVEQHIIEMTGDVCVIRDLLEKVMETYLKPLQQAGIMFGNPNLRTLHPYALQSKMGNLPPGQGYLSVGLTILATLTRIMGYLLEGTVKMCCRAIGDIVDGGDDAPKATKGKKGDTLRSKPAFQELVKKVNELKRNGLPQHPKMDKLQALILQHLTQALPDDPEEAPASTRVMVFATNRDCVEEIVETLNMQKPMIRAHRFIGQGSDRQGGKGMTQKEQLDVISRFKADEFNVLVATCIGEEGLDIGEVDLIVCYDAQKTPIRMLQRLGRTGRKRAGRVDVLLAEGREELNLDKAKDQYKEVQRNITRGKDLEFYGDVERLIPAHIKPEVIEKVMDIVPYIRENSLRKAREPSGNATKKRKRDDNIERNIPPGASTGFKSVRDLLEQGGKGKKASGSKKKARSPTPDIDLDAESDDIDREIAAGLDGPWPLRALSEPEPSTSKKKGKGKGKGGDGGTGQTVKRSKTVAGGERTKNGKKKKESELEQELHTDDLFASDDSIDRAIERGLVPPSERKKVKTKRKVVRENDSGSDGEVMRSPAKKKSKKSRKVEENQDDDEPPPTKRKSKKKSTREEASQDPPHVGDVDGGDEDDALVKRSKRRKEPRSEGEDEQDSAGDGNLPVPKKSKKKSKEVEDENANNESAFVKQKKRSRRVEDEDDRVSGGEKERALFKKKKSRKRTPTNPGHDAEDVPDSEPESRPPQVKKGKKKSLMLPSPSEDELFGDDDDVDLPSPSKLGKGAFTTASKILSASNPPARSQSEVIDLTDSDCEEEHEYKVQISLQTAQASSTLRETSQLRGSSMEPQVGQNNGNMSWLLDNDDDDGGLGNDSFNIKSSSPPRRSASPLNIPSSIGKGVSFATNLSDKAKGKRKADISILDISSGNEDGMDIDEAKGLESEPPQISSPDASASFAMTQPVRAAGQARKRTFVDIPSSEPVTPAVPSRIARFGERPAKRQRSESRQPHVLNRLGRHVRDDMAIHSGGETSEGTEGSEDEERESDREFLLDSPTAAKVSPTYAQTQVYQDSLLSQAPARARSGPVFAKAPKRFGRFAGGRSPPKHRAPVVLSSPIPEDDVNEYEFDSFLVDDQDAIVYETDED